MFDYHSDLYHKGYIVRDEKRDEIDKKEYKNKNTFSPPKRAMDCCIQTLLHTDEKMNSYKNEKGNFFADKESFQKAMISNSFNNRNAITKTRFSSHNLVINNTEWYNV